MSEGNQGQTPEAIDEHYFVSKLTSEPFYGKANNQFLRDALGWDEDRYWQVRNRLLDNGLVQKAHGGPGGKTLIAPPIPTLVAIPASDPEGLTPLTYVGESSLYEPVREQILRGWIKDEGYDSYVVRITAAAGRRDTGGTWTRPDISMVGIQKFKFLRDPVFDVVSFEIKPKDQITVEAIFEALAHRQSTTRAYAVFHSTNDDFNSKPEAGRIVALAEAHGVGVILADDPARYGSWAERVRAKRWLPDPADLNDFIQRVFPSTDHDEIIKLTK